MAVTTVTINPLNAELNPICALLALFGANHIFHVSMLRVNCAPLKVLSSGYCPLHLTHFVNINTRQMLFVKETVFMIQ